MNREKKFQKRKEDFICDNCKENVRGDGYTDHCPRCLWSKHLDISPGDRREKCSGSMKPITVKVVGGKNIIYYCCLACGAIRRVKATEEDSVEEIIKLTKNSFYERR